MFFLSPFSFPFLFKFISYISLKSNHTVQVLLVIIALLCSSYYTQYATRNTPLPVRSTVL
jgi:hypothetical protein